MNKSKIAEQATVEAYNKKYSAGYGIAYPESHIIRVNKQILEYELGLTGGVLFDYGCGTGTHLKYFADNGDWECYGADVAAEAIDCAAKKLSEPDNLFVIDPKPNLVEVFSARGKKPVFDLIISNQVLYFLSNEDLADLLAQFHALLSPQGIVVFSMMSTQCYYYDISTPVEGSSLRRVEFKSGRLKGDDVTFINFKTAEETLALFAPWFDRVHFGFYDSRLRDDEGSVHHHLFVGRKKRI